MATQETWHPVKDGDAEFNNVDVAGDLTVTGTFTPALTEVTDFSVTDDLTVGDDLTVTGLATIGETLAVTGVLTATGGVVGGLKETVVAVTADGAIAVPASSRSYFITKSGVAAMTLVDPTATTHDGIRLTFIAANASAHTLDLVTGINGGAADVGTFGGALGDGVVIEAYQGVWYEVPGANANVSWA